MRSASACTVVPELVGCYVLSERCICKSCKEVNVVKAVLQLPLLSISAKKTSSIADSRPRYISLH
ncbi:hypothetical protein BDV96DRAFT_586244 [Lophiotrema nucula]|uniref:Uncharacterized protein n=1 Tax=Lophiotrema nucula TaxID=690887 RepID=A0A6A5YPL9_9PLEO|nr:hypothetical protein BDV96DRAFT_586244 [Lophiotrema nucula]